MREIFSLPRKFAASLLQLQGRIALNLNGWTLEMAALPWNGVSNSHSAEKSHGRWSLFNEYHSLEICLDSGHSMPWRLMWKMMPSDFLKMMLWSQLWYSRFWVESMCHHMSNWAWLWSTLPLHWAPLLPLYLSNVSFSPLWFASHPEGFLALLNKWLTHLSYLILPLFILQDRDISGSLFVWLSLSKYRAPIWENKSSCVEDAMWISTRVKEHRISFNESKIVKFSDCVDRIGWRTNPGCHGAWCHKGWCDCTDALPHFKCVSHFKHTTTYCTEIHCNALQRHCTAKVLQGNCSRRGDLVTFSTHIAPIALQPLCHCCCKGCLLLL